MCSFNANYKLYSLQCVYESIEKPSFNIRGDKTLIYFRDQCFLFNALFHINPIEYFNVGSIYDSSMMHCLIESLIYNRTAHNENTDSSLMELDFDIMYVYLAIYNDTVIK